MRIMRRVVIVAFPRVQTLDVHGPAEVFTTATQLSGRDGYVVEVVAHGAGPLPTSSVALVPRPHRSTAAAARSTRWWPPAARESTRPRATSA